MRCLPPLPVHVRYDASRLTSAGRSDEQLRDAQAGGVQQLDERAIAQAARRRHVGLCDESIDVLDREVAWQHLPGARRPQIVGGTGRQAAVDDEKAVEAAVAGDGAGHRTRRAALRHQVAHEAFEIRARQRIDGPALPDGEVVQAAQIARVALDRVARPAAARRSDASDRRRAGTRWSRAASTLR